MNELNLPALRAEREELCEWLDSLTGNIERDRAEMRASGDTDGLAKLETAQADLMAQVGHVERLLRVN